jgi:hypothetical protein
LLNGPARLTQLVDLMGHSTEKVALKLMKAFAAEHEREPDATKCRTAGVIAGKICGSQEEFDRVMEFVGPRRMGLVQAWRRSDGLAVQPNKVGYEWIAGHKRPFTLQRLYWIVGIIFVLATFAWGVFVWLNRQP